MMCSIFESLAYNVRDTDDLLNPAGAAAVTGMVYKATEAQLWRASGRRPWRRVWAPRRLPQSRWAAVVQGGRCVGI